MGLYESIRAAGDGAIVAQLADEAGVERDQAEQALRSLLPGLGRAIRRTGESRTGAPAKPELAFTGRLSSVKLACLRPMA